MIDDVKVFETTPPVRAPKLVVVAAGSAEANAAQGFGSPVLLDTSRDVASLYGANGTPMAVIVDASGRIASPLAAGAPAVLALIRGG